MVEQVELALAVIGCDVLRDAVKALQKMIGNPVSAGAGRFQCGYCMGPRRPCPSHFLRNQLPGISSTKDFLKRYTTFCSDIGGSYCWGA